MTLGVIMIVQYCLCCYSSLSGGGAVSLCVSTVCVVTPPCQGGELCRCVLMCPIQVEAADWWESQMV